MEPIIAVTVNSGWHRLKPLLAAAGHPDPENAEAPHHEFESQLGTNETSSALLLWTRPETVLEQAMMRNEDPAQALAEWTASARSLLHGYRRNRRKSLLVDVEHAATAPDEFLRACADHLALRVPAEVPPLEDAARDETASDPIVRLIATQWATSTPEVEELLMELQASTQPLREPCESAIDCAAAWQEYRTAQEERQDEIRLQELQEENDILLKQLHKVQEELESYYLELQDEKSKRSKAEDTVEKRDQKIREQAAAIKEKDKSYQNLLAQKQRLFRQLQDMRTSRSWRVTAPMRALVQSVNGRRARQ